MKDAKSIFEKLGVFGLESIEDHILVGLVTGDPILLVGRHGSGKTMLTRKLAEAMGVKYIAYDASKALFDDVIGFPDPQSLSKGVLDYIPTPISIWDKEFVLVDEISRANPSMQNKWLEVIRSRSVMGKEVKGLKYVFAAMNPVSSYVGAIALDPALSGRFSFIIPIPEAYTMDNSQIRKIIKNITHDDANALNVRENNGSCKNNAALKELVNESRLLFKKVSEKYDKDIEEYILKFTSNLTMNKIKLDGRRLGMIRRNCIAYLSIKTVKYGRKDIEDSFLDHIYECIKYSIPEELTGEPVKEEIIMSTHSASVRDKTESSKYILWANIISENSLEKMIDKYISGFKQIEKFNHYEILYIITEKHKNMSSVHNISDIYFALKKLVSFYSYGKEFVKTGIESRVLSLFSEISSLTRIFERGRICIEHEGLSNLCRQHDKGSETALRLCLNYISLARQSHRKMLDSKLYEEIRYILEKRNENQRNNKNSKKPESQCVRSS